MEPMEKRSVSDFTLSNASIAQPMSASLAKALSRLRINDKIFLFITRASAFFVLVLLSAIIGSLVVGAWPALQQFGFGFLTSERWNPVTENSGLPLASLISFDQVVFTLAATVAGIGM
jgi:phosphate transport system permease protein